MSVPLLYLADHLVCLPSAAAGCQARLTLSLVGHLAALLAGFKLICLPASESSELS